MENRFPKESKSYNDEKRDIKGAARSGHAFLFRHPGGQADECARVGNRIHDGKISEEDGQHMFE